MTTLTTEEQSTLAASSATQEPKATKKANTRAQKPHVAPSKRRSGKSSTPAKKGAKARKQAGGDARQGSKTEKVLDLLKRAGGATLKDVMKATSWQAHSVRGFISGTIGKKMGLKVESTKSEEGERVYSLTK